MNKSDILLKNVKAFLGSGLLQTIASNGLGVTFSIASNAKKLGFVTKENYFCVSLMSMLHKLTKCYAKQVKICVS